MATSFHDAWRRSSEVLAEADFPAAQREHDPRPEALLVNSVVAELQREVDYSTRFYRNVNELRSTARLVRDAALSDPGTRQVCLQDSRVAAGALSKGRSAAPQLNRELRQCLPSVIGGMLAPGSAFVPSRWNPADGPTRDRPIRPPERCRL